jgi:hypothetical protein
VIILSINPSIQITSSPRSRIDVKYQIATTNFIKIPDENICTDFPPANLPAGRQGRQDAEEFNQFKTLFSNRIEPIKRIHFKTSAHTCPPSCCREQAGIFTDLTACHR